MVEPNVSYDTKIKVLKAIGGGLNTASMLFSKKVCTLSLAYVTARELEKSGLIRKIKVNKKQTKYELTEKGKKLLEVVG